jgi:hypothetical protein
MLGDIQIYDAGAFGSPGDVEYAVAAGTVKEKIKAGEPVAKALGGFVVTAMATNSPSVGTNFIAGIATTTSTDTVAAAGTVKVMKMRPGQSFLIAPNVAATWNTQAKYDLLVGDRVFIDLTGTAALGTATYTILASDDTYGGCVILPLDIQKYPNMVRFAFRDAVDYLA